MKYESEKMLTSSAISDVISFFVTRKCQKIQQNDENWWLKIENWLYKLQSTKCLILMKSSLNMASASIPMVLIDPITDIGSMYPNIILRVSG